MAIASKNHSGMSDIEGGNAALVASIMRLKKERNAVILAHNYQTRDVQDVADFVGDSLDLCIKSTQLDDVSVIVFCGVDFMAETAAILNPGKTVIIPDKAARCPMAAMLEPEEIVEAKRGHAGAPVVLYINTTAACKAEADSICTSANAAAIVNALPGETILFGPDANMAHWVRKETDKTVIPVPRKGYCVVHERLITADDVRALQREHPDAVVLAHPECRPEVQDIADHLASTNQMITYARELDATEFIVATEEGLCHRLRKEVPGKTFYAIERAVCVNMKRHTLEKIRSALESMTPTVTVDAAIAAKAKQSIDTMFLLMKKTDA